MPPLNAVVLAAVLARATYSDLRFHRISNQLSVLGLVAGLGLQGLGGGLQGLISGALGALVGFACFAPFYALRAMGAGDVKLLAVVGAFLGPQGCFYAALASLLAGGLGAISYVLWSGARAFITFVREGFGAASAAAFSSARIARRDRLPFALPIAVGGIVVSWHLAGSAEITAWLRGASH
jgi:prepilin peptidase CpaA